MTEKAIHLSAQKEHEHWQWQKPGEAWKGAGMYHITLKIPSHEPLLGSLIIPDNDPAKAYVKRASLGEAVLDILRGLPSFYPEIQVIHYCLMPDHLHSIWYVRKSMPRGISSAVRGFWQEVKKAGRFSSFAPNSIREEYQEKYKSLRDEIGKDRYDAIPPVFTEMPHIRPMGQRRQLPTTLRYIDMNPQRLATKRLKPDFFRVQPNIEIAGRMYCGIGNSDLLQREKYMPVHVRRTMIDEAMHGDDKRLRDYMNSCVLAARKGTVMVSPFIHEKEREVLIVLLAEGHSVIYLADNGFGEYYKPSDGLFEAVANKQVLILSPWPYNPKKRGITRAECVALNKMAEGICALSSFAPRP